MKKLKFYSGAKVPNATADMARQTVSGVADAFVPGAGQVMNTAAALSKKFGKEDCEIDPVTGKEVCQDNSSIAGGVLKSTLDPIGSSVNMLSNLSKGNVTGAIAATPLGKIFGVKDNSNDEKLEEIKKQLQKQKEAQINKANQSGINQGLMQQQNSFNSPAFGMRSFRKGGKLKFQKGGVTDCSCNKDTDGIDTDILFDLPQQIIDGIHEMSGVGKGKKYDNSTKEKIKQSAKSSGKSLRDFITQIPNAEKQIIVIEKFQQGGNVPAFVKNPKNNTEKVMAEKWKKQNPSANVPIQKKELSGVSKWVSENIHPFGYGEDVKVENNSNFLDKANSIFKKVTENNRNMGEPDAGDKRRMDAFKMYLGGDESYQDNGTIVKSKTSPSKGDNKNDTYYTFKDDDIKTKLFETYRKAHTDTKGLSIDDEMAVSLSDEAQLPEERERIKALKNNLPLLPFGKKNLQDIDASVMGNYTANVGKDEKGDYVSFYDKWDLAPNVFEKNKKSDVGLGTPMQLYDRIYYDPKTKERIAEKPTMLKPFTIRAKRLQTGGTNPDILEKIKELGYQASKLFKAGKIKEANKLGEQQANMANDNGISFDRLGAETIGHPTSISGISHYTFSDYKPFEPTQKRTLYENFNINKKANTGYNIVDELSDDTGRTKKVIRGTTNTRKPDTKFKPMISVTGYKKGGYLKDKNTYITKNGKETKRGLWSNVYLKNKNKHQLGGLTSLLSNAAVMQGVGSMFGSGTSPTGAGNITGAITGMLPNLIGGQQANVQQVPNKQLSYQEFVNQMIQEGKITQIQATDTTMQQQLQQAYNQYLQQNKQGSIPTMKQGGVPLKFKR
jgi:hypothetical protein